MLEYKELANVSHETLTSNGYVLLVGMIIAGSLIALFVRSFFSDRKLRYATSSITEFIHNQSEVNRNQVSFNAQVSSAIMLLTQDRISECSPGQVKILSKCVIDSLIIDIIYGTMDVVSKNHLKEKQVVKRRVENMACNAIKNASSYMDMFIYNGKTMAALVDQDMWFKQTVDMVMESIYAEDKLMYLSRETVTLRNTLSLDYYEKMKV